MKCKFNKRTGLFWRTPANVDELAKHLNRRGIASREMVRWPVPKNNPTKDGLKCRWTDQVGLTIAEVHYYELPDGTIGGTGRRLPEPLILVHGGIAYDREKESLPTEGSPFRYDGSLYWLVRLHRWLRCLILGR